MKVKELIKNLQKHDPNKEIMFWSDDGVYAFDLDELIMMSMTQKYLDNIVFIHIKKELY